MAFCLFPPPSSLQIIHGPLPETKIDLVLMIHLRS